MKNKFSKQVYGDVDAFYMSCPEVVGKHIANRLKNFNSCVELCSAIGLLSVQLAKVMDKVCAIEINKERIKNAVKNAKLYEVSDKVVFIEGDVLDENLLKSINVEVAILDPDWSKEGDEKEIHVNDIEKTQPSWKEIFNLTNKYITRNIVSRIPKTWNFETLKEFGPCKLENIYWGGKFRFKIAYFLEEVSENSEEDIFFES